jgi:hypothetical protein
MKDMKIMKAMKKSFLKKNLERTSFKELSWKSLSSCPSFPS